MEQILAIINKEFPEKAIDIGESIDLLLYSIDELIKDINNKITHALNKRDYNKTKSLTELSEAVYNYETMLRQIFNDIEPDNIIDEVENEKEESTKSSPNYNECLVDFNIPHTLYEDFTHVRPHSFQFKGQKYEVRTWQEVLLKTSEILYTLDMDKFEQFQYDRRMNGKKVQYFSKVESEMRKPVKLKSADIFIETNMSANSIRNLIAKMLQKYDFKISDYKLFFKTDYSSLHNENKNGGFHNG